ncbi:hypothetical protein [Phaeocystidibacter luteus]|uniref:Porin n=1 Tax=Phaeocystidibacter luteus TaxID=911197 RepID=A0A6N6RJG6_9FLAO|nr:hypothetical protein [Phaeocystidibacter luteus]KAB2813853.1 hypothetical protein F8C67_03990 [Phaeocystidibacter luteus]
MKRVVYTLFASAISLFALGQNWQFGGYLKYLPSQTFINEGVLPPEFQGFLPKSYTDQVIHNRLNINWANKTDRGSYAFEAGIRNRLFYGYTASQPAFIESLREDPGLVDMRWLWTDGDVLFHTEIDRLNFTFRQKNFTLRIGRQRINWGIHDVFNPNDIFNQYNYFDFDYEERPGADAVFAQYYLGDGFSSLELAFSPNFEQLERSTAGLIYKSNANGYDYQALIGYTYYDVVLGGGWAGSLGGAGFKGEAAYYYSTDSTQSENNFTASVGLDYMFSSGIYGMVSYLYNGMGELNPTIADQLSLRQARLSSKNIFPYRHTIMVSASYPINPIWNVNLAWFQSHNFDQAAFVPGVTYSISNDWDAMLIAQIFTVRPTGDSNSIALFNSALFARLKWSF